MQPIPFALKLKLKLNRAKANQIIFFRTTQRTFIRYFRLFNQTINYE